MLCFVSWTTAHEDCGNHIILNHNVFILSILAKWWWMLINHQGGCQTPLVLQKFTANAEYFSLSLLLAGYISPF